MYHSLPVSKGHCRAALHNLRTTGETFIDTTLSFPVLPILLAVRFPPLHCPFC